MLLAASKRWGAITGKDRLAVFVKFEGAKLHKDDLVATFLADKDELLVGFSDASPNSRSTAAVPEVDDLEKALSVFFDENLFEGGRAKTVAELEEFQGLSNDYDNEDDECDDDAKAICLAVALYNFVPEEPDEIGFVVGDTMVVYRKREDGWWRGRHLDGPNNKLAGYFPGNRVKVTKEGPLVTAPAAAAAGAAVEQQQPPQQQPQQQQATAAPERRATVHVTMETETVVVQTAPGHGSPETVRGAVLEAESVRVQITKTTMSVESEAVTVAAGSPLQQQQQPVLPRRSVSMESRVLAAGAALAAEGRFAEAAAALSVPEGASTAALCFARGEAREKSGEARLALLDYSAALAQQPLHLGALLGRARLAAQAGRFAVARHDALAVLRAQPRSVEAMLLAAQVRTQQCWCSSCV